MSELARQLGITKATVSGVLKGKGTSKRVMDAAAIVAQQLLDEEQQSAA